MQISNQIPSSYCSTDVHCYNSLTFLNTLTTSWLKKCFCHYVFYCFGGVFFVWFFFCIYLNTCTCKRLYNVCTLVYKRKIQILQFIRNVGPHIPISLINHFILSYIFSTRQLQILSWKNNIKIWSHISFWIPYMNERFFFITKCKRPSLFFKVQQFAT